MLTDLQIQILIVLWLMACIIDGIIMYRAFFIYTYTIEGLWHDLMAKRKERLKLTRVELNRRSLEDQVLYGE